ncbi:MAG: Heterocyst differentiation ATP-binding protein HepA [Chlamydiales bacterium]|nr:Heterocyst differentiation ATP-binding protein HepA [Chlamydiales bacterium]MCH9619503.1 Heterocyst differentiation ATP-binding protein HepA [Chlamydiales bacterium]MCH9622307.1 Heterocyst differentiation ATP-binding protein HepA [Chlamydiales bacterium]
MKRYLADLKPLFLIIKNEKKTHLTPLFFHYTLQLLGAFLEGFTFLFIYAAISTLTGETSLLEKSNATLQRLHLSPIFQLENPFPNFVILLILSISIQILKSLCIYGATVLHVVFLNRLQVRLQRKLREQLFSFTFSSISQYKVGELISIAKIPYDTLYGFVNSLSGFLQSTIFISILFSILFFISPLFTLSVLILVIGITTMQRGLVRTIKKCSLAYSDQITNFMKLFTQLISGIRVITTFHRFNYVNRKLEECTQKTIHSLYKLSWKSNTLQQFNEIGAMCVVAICAFIGYLFLKNQGAIGISLLVTYLAVLLRTANRVPQVMSGLGGMAQTWGEFRRLMHLLSPEGKEYAPNGSIALPPFQQEIYFKNIDHSYDGKRTILHNISLSIKKGEAIALVGQSGSGKSTIVDLLTRLYDPSKGDILIDTIPLREIDLQSWRDQIGVVSQDTFIFNDTIRNNICFGLDNISDKMVQQVAQIAGCHTFIKHLPGKYEAILGERGYRLSGGERQRLSLARALLQNPEVLILDEATSALDTRTERYILDALEQFYGKKTLLVVAHRLSTIIGCDKIYVIEKGEFIESGSHEELLQKRGTYAQMWEAQLHGSEKELLTAGDLL